MNMNLTSRNFNKDPKNSRTSSRYYGEPPQSGRFTAQILFPEPALKANCSTRQSQQGLGIFASQLNRKLTKFKEERELPIQFTQVLDYQNGKVRSSKKTNQYQKQSRDEFYQNYQSSQEAAAFGQGQKELLKNELRQEIESNMLDKVKKMLIEQSSKIRESLGDILSQTNNAFRKKQEAICKIRSETQGLKQEVAKLTKSYLNFCQQHQQKTENLHVEFSNLAGIKRSKTGDYNMDLKNSFQGLNSSLNASLAHQNHGSKLINQVIYQIDAIKRDLSQNKTQIQLVKFETNSKILQLRKGNTERKSEVAGLVSVKYQDIQKLVSQMLKGDKKNSKMEQEIQKMQTQFFNIDFRIKKQQQVILDMNSEVTSIFNSQVNPKIKKIQASLADVFSRIDQPALDEMIVQKIEEDLKLRLKDVRTLRVRSCSKQEQSKLSMFTGQDKHQIGYKQTYLLDEQSYLLDSQGNYLVQQLSGSKQRIQLQNEQLYLLQLQGIEIISAPC